MKKKTSNDEIKEDGLKALLADGLIKLGSNDEFNFQRIPFGIIALDDLIGGGVPKKKITLLTGPTNVGKSFLALLLSKQVQSSGGQVVWVDTEMSWDGAWAQKCGVNVDAVGVAQPETGEVAFNVVQSALKLGIDLVVLDSIAGLLPTAFAQEDFSYNPVAAQARMVNQAFPRIVPYLKNGSALVLINQMRSSLGPTAIENMPGGLAQYFFSHFILTLRRNGWIEDKSTKQRLGFDIEIRCRKSKVGGKIYQSCIVPFMLEGGIDYTETQIREALNQGLIKQSGPWFAIGEQRLQGMNGVRAFLLENKEIKEALFSKLKKDNKEAIND